MTAWIRDHRVRVVGVLLVASSLVAMGMSYRTSVRQQHEAAERERFVACQANYNQANNERTRILTEATDKERAADRRVTEAQAALWLQPRLIREAGQPIDPAVLAAFRELQAALTNWRAVTAEVDKERQAHPVPPPPNAVCGGP